jgi:hypothetical protein
MAARLEWVCGELLTKVSRSREAELEASGRASGLQFAVEALRAENHSLRTTNEMLIARAFGSPAPAAQPSYGPSVGLPTIVAGVPLGSPRHNGGQPGMDMSAFDPSLPPAGVAHVRPATDYALGGMNELDPFSDVGDDEAQRRGIKTDDLTGALEGGPSIPQMPRRTQ